MTSLHTNDRPPQKPWLAIGVVVALLIVAANLAGYLIYTSRSEPEQPAKIEPVAAVAPDDKPSQTISLAEEQREAGVRALRAGKYAKAITSFEAALKLDPKIADAPVLLDVARQLADSEAAADAPAPVKRAIARTPEPEPEAEIEEAQPSRTNRNRRVRRTPKRRKRVAREEVDEEPEDGTLVVTTEPAALLVEIDDNEPERSPVALDLPPGPHTVRILDGETVLEEKRVVVASGQRERVVGDYTKRLARAAPPPPPPESPAASASMSKADDLDLVALLDRDAPKEDAAAVAPAETAPTSERLQLKPTPGSATPRLVVFWPGRSSGGLQQSMRAEMSGVDVRVVSRTGDFRRALSDPTDAVMASPYVLRQNGLAPQLSAQSADSGRYLAVALERAPVKATLSSGTIGVVDELGRNQMPIFVQRLLGSTRTPTLRRVTKVEDLLPLLQFSIAKAVLVKERDFPLLESRTQQRLYTIPISAKSAPLAVAFADGGRRSMVERAVRGLGGQTKQSLGVESWTTR